MWRPCKASSARITLQHRICVHQREEIQSVTREYCRQPSQARLAPTGNPRLRQVFVEHLEGVQGPELEREMFILRKLIEKEKTHRIAAAGGDPADFYICTLSNRTIVYKARAPVLRQRSCKGPCGHQGT